MLKLQEVLKSQCQAQFGPHYDPLGACLAPLTPGGFSTQVEQAKARTERSTDELWLNPHLNVMGGRLADSRVGGQCNFDNTRA